MQWNQSFRSQNNSMRSSHSPGRLAATRGGSARDGTGTARHIRTSAAFEKFAACGAARDTVRTALVRSLNPSQAGDEGAVRHSAPGGETQGPFNPGGNNGLSPAPSPGEGGGAFSMDPAGGGSPKKRTAQAWTVSRYRTLGGIAPELCAEPSRSAEERELEVAAADAATPGSPQAGGGDAHAAAEGGEGDAAGSTLQHDEAARHSQQLARLNRLLETQPTTPAPPPQATEQMEQGLRVAEVAADHAAAAADAADAAAARATAAEAAAAAAERAAKKEGRRHDSAIEKMHEMLTAMTEQVTTALEALEKRVAALEDAVATGSRDAVPSPTTLISNPYFHPDGMRSPHTPSGSAHAVLQVIEPPHSGGSGAAWRVGEAAAAATASGTQARALFSAPPDPAELDSTESISALSPIGPAEEGSLVHGPLPTDMHLAIAGDHTAPPRQHRSPHGGGSQQRNAEAGPQRSNGSAHAAQPNAEPSPDARRTEALHSPAAFGSIAGESPPASDAAASPDLVPRRSPLQPQPQPPQLQSPEFLKPAHVVRAEQKAAAGAVHAEHATDVNARIADLLQSRNELNMLRFVQRTSPVWGELSADVAQRLLQIMCKCEPPPPTQAT